MFRTTSRVAHQRPAPRRSLLVRGARSALVVPLVLFCLAYLGLVLLILLKDHGTFTYTLDDPYIHLALAENITHGHYGVNSTELSAPSSSILWPVLLAPVAGLPGGDLAPLLINLLASLGVLAVAHRIISAAFADVTHGATYDLIALLLILFVLFTNMLGLALTGMEHSLQVLCAAVVVLGMIVERSERRVPWWFACALVLGPLIRYESLGLSVPALVYLLWRRHTAIATVCGAVLGAVIGGFSLFLYAAGLGVVPTSVVAKMSYAATGGGGWRLVNHLVHNINLPEGMLLLIGIAALLANRRTDQRALVWWGAAAALLHLALGQFGWYGRYEIYIVVVVWLLVLHFYAPAIVAYSQRRVAAISVLLLLTFGMPYLYTVATTSIASSDIYQQQYQMHRFATDYYRGAVAVNDLGWVAYRNPAYVLDLGGLASREALDNRSNTSNMWLDRLAHEHGVRFAMIYDAWFGGAPPSWIAVGKLYLDHTPIVDAEAVVTFYALDPATAAAVQPLLERFRASLPPGVRFEPSAARR